MIALTTNNVIILVSVVFIAIAAALIVLALKEAMDDTRKIKQRLEGRWEGESKESILRHNQAFDSFANHLTMPDEAEVSKIRAALARAGFYGTSSVKYYYAVRILFLIVPQLVFLLSWAFLMPDMEHKSAIITSCALIFFGLMGPPLFIRHLENRRMNQIRNGFPDMMDLTVASLEAGLGMNAALLRVADEIGGRYPALKINLDLLNMELRAGRDRHTGMMNFAERVNLDEARSLSVMLHQAEKMGSSLGKSLRTFSDEMRNKRMMRAEEKAMALPAKLTVPLILFIFPSIMGMLLIPTGIRISSGLL